jgi:hypothetical protein
MKPAANKRQLNTKSNNLLNIKLLLKDQIQRIRCAYQSPMQIIHKFQQKRTDSKSTIPKARISKTRPPTGASTPIETPFESPAKHPIRVIKKSSKTNCSENKGIIEKSELNISSRKEAVNKTIINITSSHSNIFIQPIIQKHKEKLRSNNQSPKLSNFKQKRIMHSHKNSLSNEEPGMVVTKYSYFSKVGFLPDNPYKPNQDNYIISVKINSNPSLHFFGVADGHGNTVY